MPSSMSIIKKGQRMIRDERYSSLFEIKKKARIELTIQAFLVLSNRLELLRLSALVPKTSVSTNSTTWAHI